MSRSLPQADRGMPLVTTTAEYALRALAELAACHSSGEAVRSVDLAAATGVPEAYLAKVLQRLVSHGLLVGSKGHGGGFTLARPPAKILFSDVLEALDAMPSQDRCAFGLPRCSKTHPCLLHPAFSGLSRLFGEWARTTTLADVAG